MADDELYALLTSGESRFSIGSAGVVIGRSARCDVIVDGEAVSRMQAVVYPEPEGPMLVVLGRAETSVNGIPVEGACRLAAGDVLELAGARYEVACERGSRADAEVAWMIRDDRGQLCGVSRASYTVGGGADTALRIAGWPHRVMVLHRADRLHVEAIEPIAVAGAVVAPGEVVVAAVDDVLAYRDRTFRVIAGGAAHGAATSGERGAPDRAVLELLPRGGRLVLGWGAHERALYLPERRCELIALLLQPPAPYSAGELVPDEIIARRLQRERPLTRVELNVLIHRARTDLLRAELDGAALIERATGGTATRFVLAAAARVAVI